MSKRVKLALIVPPALLVVVAFVLAAAGVTLGQGSFAYRWSPWQGTRLLNGLLALPGIFVLAMAIRSAGRERLGLGPATAATIGALLLTAWNWGGPPRPEEQHYLNFMSPSHEGAFVLEARSAKTVSEYVKLFPSRQALSIDAIKGTRVLSNPPGMTMLTLLIRQYWGPGMIDDMLREAMETATVAEAALAFKLSIVLALIWVMSLLPLYYAARCVLPPAAALAAASCAVFAPSCLDFSPGKDPAQLLISAVLLLAATMMARSSKAGIRIGGAFLFGAAAAFGALFSLLIVWIALACGLWALYHFVSLRHRHQSLAAAIPVAVCIVIGAAAVAGLFRWTVGLDLIATSRAVAAKYAEVQPLIKVDHRTWLMIGLPIVLLFAPAALFTALLLRKGITRRTHMGTVLLLITLGVMAATYVVGVPYELPRLWAPFLPPLIVGAFAAAGVCHWRSRKVRRLLAWIVLLSISAGVLHWTRLDVRESEYRLVTNRLLN